MHALETEFCATNPHMGCWAPGLGFTNAGYHGIGEMNQLTEDHVISSHFLCFCHSVVQMNKFLQRSIRSGGCGARQDGIQHIEEKLCEGPMTLNMESEDSS